MRYFAPVHCPRRLRKQSREKSPDTGVFYFTNKEELIESLKNYRKTGDTILVKASHFMGFADVVKAMV